MINIRIGDLFNVEKGSLQSSKNTPGIFDFITASETWKTNESYTHECEALIFAAAASGSLGRTHYVKGKFIASDLCFILTPKNVIEYYVDLKFYHFVFNNIREKIVKATKTGTSKDSINITNFSNYEISYTDKTSQRLWIEKLKKAEIIQYDLLQINYEQQSYIKQLRQAILQEAVQGKLTQQNKADEPASTLLQRIKNEKQKLIAAGKLKKEKELPIITKDEIPFELPKGWVWCRLGEITSNLDYGTSEKAFSDGEVPVLRMGNVQDSELIFSNLKYVRKAIKDLPRLFLKNKDLVFNRTNSFELVGKCGVYFGNNEEYTLASYLIRITLAHEFISAEFTNYYINSKICRETQIEPQITQQTGQANFSGSKLKNILFPLAPLSEQHRIVTKVQQLLQILNQLEQQVAQSQTQVSQLLQAVLKEVFSLPPVASAKEGKEKLYEENELLTLAAEE